MKYLKTFESKDIDKTYIEDLFGDLKDICNFSSWNGGENDELLVTNIRLPEMPIMRINAPDDFGPSIAPNRINIRNLNELNNDYPDKIKKVFSEIKKIIRLCNCRYQITSDDNTIMIIFRK